eukprot:1158580-Pelagomonas_calceolata.AAC.15
MHATIIESLQKGRRAISQCVVLHNAYSPCRARSTGSAVTGCHFCCPCNQLLQMLTRHTPVQKEEHPACPKPISSPARPAAAAAVALPSAPSQSAAPAAPHW